MKKRIYYSVYSGGDGSAGVTFFEDAECAEAHQEIHNADEGWAEDCSGYLTYEGNAVFQELVTKEKYIKELEEELEWIEEDEEYGEDEYGFSNRATLVRKYLKQFKGI